MKLSVSAFRGAQTSAHKKLFNTSSPFHYGGLASKFSSSPASTTAFTQLQADENPMMVDKTGVGPGGGPNPPVKSDSTTTSESQNEQPSPSPSSNSHSPRITVSSVKSAKDEHRATEKSQRTRSNQRWMKLRTTVQLSGAISSTIQKPKPQLKREDSFLKRFSTRQIPETQETLDTGDDGDDGSSSQDEPETLRKLRRRKRRHRKKQPSTVVNPDENFYYYWLFLVSVCVLYNLWTLIVRQSFPEFQELFSTFWFSCDNITDLVFVLDIVVQFRTGYLEQGLMVYDAKKLAKHYVKSRSFVLDLMSMVPLQLLQFKIGTAPILRFPRFIKVYRVYDYYYMVESRTVYPNLWRVVNLIHILLILAHWFGCFYYLLSEAEGFKGDWVYPYRPGEYATLTRKYLGSLYWSTLTLTTIGDLPTPETNAEFIFTIVSYLIGVFIFATIVGQVGNVITNRNANRLEFERLLDGAKTYMRHHKVPSGMKRRVLRWYDYSWSRGRILGGGDINTALGLLPDKLKTELALHVNLSVLKKVTIFQECQPEFLHDLVLKMKAFIFTPGDLICRKGEVAREMFIIADGILEVISETGHVLTTMMAGDFFGEIGILNLDGLNKRTADVRSVGYSELFSLSREDVLAAMKDYPEAQEILQTLGRKRLMEARNVTKAVIEHRKQLELKSMVENAALAADQHRSKNKIVERICSDVKGLKSVLRKSRRGTKSEDSLELQPLTSISEKTDSQIHVGGGKGILCRMQKVLSEDNCQDEATSEAPTERRISAGFPLLSKLKTLTDKHHQHHHLPSTQPEPSDQEQVKDETKPEVVGAGLPLIQRLLMLKQKEESEKAKSGYIPSTVRTQQSQQHKRTISSSSSNPDRKLKPAKKEVVFAVDVLPKNEDNDSNGAGSDIGGSSNNHSSQKRDFVKPWCLLRKATVNQSLRVQPRFRFRYDQFKSPKKTSANDTVSLREDRKNVNPHRCLTRLYGYGIKNAQSTLLPQNANSVDSTLVAREAKTDDYENVHGGKNDNIDCSNSNSNSSSSYVTGSRCKFSQAAFNTSGDWGLPFVKRLKILNERQKLAELEENVFVRSCSLDSSKGMSGGREGNVLMRSLSEATATEISLRSKGNLHKDADNIYSLPATFKHSDLPSPESCETLERRMLKSILKRISSGSCKISDILGCPEQGDGDVISNDVQLLRRLMNAQTVQGYVARHSTFEKSMTGQSTLRSPPSSTQTPQSNDSAAFSFDETSLIPISINSMENIPPQTDTSERKYLDRESSHSPSKNPDLIPDVDVIEDSSDQLLLVPQNLSSGVARDLCGRYPSSSFSMHTVEGMQNKFLSQVKEIEQEVRKRDMLIEVLQTKIQELQKHHERCFEECTILEDADCDISEQPFLRGDSIDTVILSPTHLGYHNQEYQPHIEHTLQLQKPKILLQNRRSWEDRSEEENLELRELPSSMVPRSVWKKDVSIDIASDDTSISTSASETDELYMQLDDDLQLTKHDQDWEVRMLAHELEKREHKESQCDRLKSDTGVQKMQLLNVRSLEERSTANPPSPSQRSISSDNIYNPLAVESTFSSNIAAARHTTSVSPDVVPVPVGASSSSSNELSQLPSGS